MKYLLILLTFLIGGNRYESQPQLDCDIVHKIFDNEILLKHFMLDKYKGKIFIFDEKKKINCHRIQAKNNIVITTRRKWLDIHKTLTYKDVGFIVTSRTKTKVSIDIFNSYKRAELEYFFETKSLKIVSLSVI
jgi:hypothetical protein